jgi:2-keto-4-pentenoate hydratase/2-oxohepta-3-ene-1,7-dioic acid hydratase in catechol pathway
MKLLTFYRDNSQRIGTIIDGKILDLNNALDNNWNMLDLLDQGEKGIHLVSEAKENAQKENNSGLLKIEKYRLAAPIPRTKKNIICLGLNYAEHVKESDSDRELPPHPVFFTKPPTSITGPFDPVIYSKAVESLDYEVELAFVIGKKCKYISKKNALEHIAGYMVFQDISARKLQRQHNQWFRGKSLDTFAPMGPYLVTPDEIGDPQNLDLWCKVNGEVRQKANTKNMIFDIKTIISTLSEGITLEIGDVIATGTPSGVGHSHPKGLLKIGDIIESGIDSIGYMKNQVISEK